METQWVKVFRKHSWIKGKPNQPLSWADPPALTRSSEDEWAASKNKWERSDSKRLSHSSHISRTYVFPSSSPGRCSFVADTWLLWMVVPLLGDSLYMKAPAGCCGLLGFHRTVESSEWYLSSDTPWAPAFTCTKTISTCTHKDQQVLLSTGISWLWLYRLLHILSWLFEAPWDSSCCEVALNLNNSCMCE